MKISQREARRLQKRVKELELVIREQHQSWSSHWPGGVHIATVESSSTCGKVKVARQLGHAVVATDNGDKLELRALPLPAQK